MERSFLHRNFSVRKVNYWIQAISNRNTDKTTLFHSNNYIYSLFLLIFFAESAQSNEQIFQLKFNQNKLHTNFLFSKHISMNPFFLLLLLLSHVIFPFEMNQWIFHEIDWWTTFTPLSVPLISLSMDFSIVSHVASSLMVVEFQHSSPTQRRQNGFTHAPTIHICPIVNR